MECSIYLADSCNMECTYCYEGNSKNPRMMDEKTLEKSLEFIVNNRSSQDEVLYIVFLGGEPLLNKERLFDAISIIQQKYQMISKYFDFSITTNGTLLDDNVIDFLVKNKFNLSISIDGDEETQSINRKSKGERNFYPIIYNNLLKLVNMRIQFNVRMTITANNVQNFYKNIKYFYEMGVERIYVGFDSFGNWTDKSLFIFDEELDKIDKYYLEEIAVTKKKILNFYDFKFSTFIAKRIPCYCSAGTSGHFIITSSGEVFPCGYVANSENNKWSLGNVSTGVDFSKFINVAKDNVLNLSKCKDCNIQFACKGTKCGFQNYKETGYLNEPSNVICRMERILFKHQLSVIKEMYKKSSDRLIENINSAFKYNVELSDIMRDLLKK